MAAAGVPGLGDLELLVLLAVVRLGAPGAAGAHAPAVRDEIASRTARDPSRGAVSVTLDRLERKGLLVSRLGEPTAERGGKAKRLYTLSPAGARALQAAVDGTQAMLDGLPRDIEGLVRR